MIFGAVAVVTFATVPVILTAESHSDAEVFEAPATEADEIPILQAAETSLEDWQWVKRPVVVFADSAADPRFVEQIALLTERYDALDERDVVIIVDTDPAARSSVRRALRPRGFMLNVIAKDGTIVTRKPRPWSVREITRQIDKLPLRQQEARDARNGS